MEPKISEPSETKVYEVGKLLPNILFDDYRKAAGINSHGLMDILRSPAHYFERRYNQKDEKESDALTFGRLLHFAILEPEHFQKHKAIQPPCDRRTIDGKRTWSEFQATLSPDSIVVPDKFLDQLTRMSERILTHKITRGLFSKGLRETTLFWNDVQTGELCKARPDFISEKGYIVDLKTSRDARTESFSRDILKYGYHIQASHYCQGAETTRVCLPKFIFVVIEKESPYEIKVMPAGVSVMGVGDQWRAKAMRTYAKCKKENKWPGYDHRAETVELPPYAEAVDPDNDDSE